MYTHMGSFTRHAESGDARSANYPFQIHVYPNDNYADQIIDYALEAAVDFCDQMKSYGAIDYYQVFEYIPPNHPFCSTNSNDSDTPDSTVFIDDFDTWYRDEGYDSRVGVHMCVDTSLTGGQAYGGDTVEKSAFNIARPAVAGFPNNAESSDRGSEGKVTVIHESLHPTIINSLVVGSEGADNPLAPENEHELGTLITPDGTLTRTPFCNNTGGANPPWDYGTCRTDADDPSGESAIVSSCSKEAVKRTTREVF